MGEQPWTCPRCGAQQPAEAAFCSRCGKSLAEAVQETMVLAPQAAPLPPAPPPLPASPAPAYYPNPTPATVPGRKPNVVPVVIVVVALTLLSMACGAFVIYRGFQQARPEAQTTDLPPTATEPEPSVTPEPRPEAPEATPTPSPEAPPAEPAPTPATTAGVSSGDAALDLVMKRSEVREWLAQVDAARAEGKRRKALFEVAEETDAAYVVHVFESVEDDDPGHTATFGWYDVAKATGEVTVKDLTQ